MYLKEIFDQLSGGELVQTNLNVIDEAQWPRVVMHINLALGDLFKRFFLREGRLTLQLHSGQTVYPIDMKYAVSNRRSRIVTDQRFIVDSTAAPFINDILMIESVIGLDGQELAMNDSADPLALSTSDTYPPTLRVPTDIVEQSPDLPKYLKTTRFEMVYRARHPKIDATSASFDPETYDVRLPDSHLQALLLYVASRVITPNGTGQFEGLAGANYWKRYEMECAQLTNAGAELDRNTGFDKLRDRGFV